MSPYKRSVYLKTLKGWGAKKIYKKIHICVILLATKPKKGNTNMNQLNSITPKAKFKHLSDESIRRIISEYNEFMTTIRVRFRATHKNHHLKVPKRNINKTTFLKELTLFYNTSLSLSLIHI